MQESKTTDIETASGSFLDAWASNPRVSRMLIKLPLQQTIKEFVLRRRRYFPISGIPIPWGYREELDAELRMRMQDMIDAK